MNHRCYVKFYNDFYICKFISLVISTKCWFCVFSLTHKKLLNRLYVWCMCKHVFIFKVYAILHSDVELDITAVLLFCCWSFFFKIESNAGQLHMGLVIVKIGTLLICLINEHWAIIQKPQIKFIQYASFNEKKTKDLKSLNRQFERKKCY